VNIDQRFINSENVMAALRASAAEYNKAVAKAQGLIADKRKSLESANVDQVQRELLRLQAIKARHTPETIKACDEHGAALKQKEQLEAQKEDAREKLDEHTGTVITTYEQTINNLLRDFQAGFRITGRNTPIQGVYRVPVFKSSLTTWR
jgi:wobble nucleotide-excising tRNase